MGSKNHSPDSLESGLILFLELENQSPISYNQSRRASSSSVECLIRIEEVEGSIPSWSTMELYD